MDNNFYTFEDAAKRNAQILKLATYDASDGMLMVPNAMSDMAKFQKTIATRFNYFKKLIQNGETTLDHLIQQVLRTNGPYCQTDLVVNEANIDEIIEKADESYAQCKTIAKNAQQQRQREEISNFLMKMAMNGFEPDGPDDDDDDEMPDGPTFLNDIGIEIVPPDIDIDT